MTKSRRGLLLAGVFGAPVFVFGNEVQQQQQHNTVRGKGVCLDCFGLFHVQLELVKE